EFDTIELGARHVDRKAPDRRVRFSVREVFPEDGGLFKFFEAFPDPAFFSAVSAVGPPLVIFEKWKNPEISYVGRIHEEYKPSLGVGNMAKILANSGKNVVPFRRSGFSSNDTLRTVG